MECRRICPRPILMYNGCRAGADDVMIPYITRIGLPVKALWQPNTPRQAGGEVTSFGALVASLSPSS